ncbi:MAG TPA: glycerophosphoryl diester phosphodiesterase [Actinomycetales bacterium]|nr:glycerophosphoryl diester phosphodiesterase [Actinomycetales bacterium]
MSSLAPENTLAAFRLCAEHGVSRFELDVDLLPDGTVIVIHDNKLDRTTDATGPYTSLTRADLAGIDAGSWFSPEFAGEPIPTLDQVVDLMNEAGLDANVELKARAVPAAQQRALVAAVARELERLHPHRDVLISSFSPLLLHEYRRVVPGARVGVLFENKRMNGLWQSVGMMLDAAALHPSNSTVTRKSVKKFRGAGYNVNVYTVNSLERAEELAEWGVTGVFTDVAQDFPADWRA